MKTVEHILQVKGSLVFTINPDAVVYEAILRMAEKEVGALPVLEAGELVGIISERDYARKVILKGRSSKETRVREIMTPNVICVNPDQTVEYCLALMNANHIRHLPVVSEGKLVGILSIGDLVKAIISDQQVIIRQLENYILQKVGMT